MLNLVDQWFQCKASPCMYSNTASPAGKMAGVCGTYFTLSDEDLGTYAFPNLT